MIKSFVLSCFWILWGVNLVWAQVPWVLIAKPTQAFTLRSSLNSQSDVSIPCRQTDQQLWVDFLTLSENLGIQTQWKPTQKQLVLTNDSAQLVVTENLPWAYAHATSRWHTLSSSPKLTDSSWWLPADTVLSQLLGDLGFQTDIVTDSMLIRVDLASDLVHIKVEKRDNGDLVNIRFSHPFRYDSFFHFPHFILRLEKAVLDTTKPLVIDPGNFVRNIQFIQNENTAQITIQVAKGPEGGEIIEHDKGRTLQILFRKPAVLDVKTEAQKAPRKKVRTIVIDPGHGGKDPGALGKKSKEKDIVLSVGKKLRDKLLQAGYQVKMTRDTDEFIELQDRPSKASKWEGDLFISLHCNAIEGNQARRKKVNGFKVYILREAKSEEDRALARRENKASMLSTHKSKAEISPVEWILLENQLNLYTKESERFAAELVASFEKGKIEKLGSGAGQAGFLVLVGAFMPAALVELGFITNPQDEVYMKSSHGQETMVNNLFKAIEAYKTASE